MTFTDFALLAGRCGLAAVFLTAGLAKLSSRQETMQVVGDLGVAPLARPISIVLPPLEIAVAIALLFAASARYAAGGALALLVIFIAAIAANLARGRKPACNCFGQLHSTPISWKTLVRNIFLAVAACWLILSGPPHPAADLWVFLSDLDSRGRRIATAATGVIGFLILNALRKETPGAERQTVADADRPELARLTQAATTVAPVAEPQPPAIDHPTPASALSGLGLPVGAAAPGFVAPDLSGQSHSLDSLLPAGIPLLLVFSSPWCESCQWLAPKLPGLAAHHQATLRLVLISHGTVEHNLAKLQDPGVLVVLLQQNYQISESYNCTSTPAAVVISPDGTIRSALALGPLAIEQLIASSA